MNLDEVSFIKGNQITKNSTFKFVLFGIILFTVLFVGGVNAEEEISQYPELGVTVGGIPLPSIGYWWGRSGVRLSGLYLNKDKKELHINVGYVLSDTDNVQQSINLLTSWVVGSDPGADYNYAATGIAYSLNYKGLFIELGLGLPWRDKVGNLDDPIVPVGYWGYIYRFRSH